MGDSMDGNKGGSRGGSTDGSMDNSSRHFALGKAVTGTLREGDESVKAEAGAIESVIVGAITAQLRESLLKVCNSMLRSLYSLCSIRFRGEFPVGKSVNETIATGKISTGMSTMSYPQHVPTAIDNAARGHQLTDRMTVQRTNHRLTTPRSLVEAGLAAPGRLAEMEAVAERYAMGLHRRSRRWFSPATPPTRSRASSSPTHASSSAIRPSATTRWR